MIRTTRTRVRFELILPFLPSGLFPDHFVITIPAGFGFKFKKVQADLVAKLMSSPEVQHFKGDENASQDLPVKTYGW